MEMDGGKRMKRAGGDKGWCKMYTIKNILVTTDFSEYSAAALDHALSLAETHRANVHLLHVIEERPGLARRKGAAESGSPRKGSRASASRQMSKFIYEHVDEYTTVQEAVRSGVPHVEFIRYAKEHGIDLIVIATHGRTGLSHVVMGSVAERVVRYSPVPVLTVKPAAVLERLVTEEDVVHDLHLPLS
jgi:nucleotide-binding universal stress UspA family protein